MKISESQRHTLSQGGMRDVLTILFKHQGKIITVFLGTFLTVSIGTFLMPSIYEAESTIMVKMGREHMYRSEVGAGGPTMSYDQERVMDSEIQILSSRDLVQKVLENLGVEKTYPEIYENLPKDMTPLDVAIEKLQKDISFSKIGEANVLKIKFEHQTPEVAAKVVNKITELLMNKHLQIYSNPQTSFLDSQLVIYREQLEESRSQLQDFKKRHKLSSFAEERNLILQERSNLQATLKSIQNKKEGLRSKLASLRRQIAEIPEHIPLVSVTERQGVIDGLKSNFLELQLKEQQLLTKYKETSRFVTDVRRDLGLVKEFLKAQEDNQTDRVTTGKNPVYQDLHIQVLRTESELTSLGPEATEMTQQATELDEKLFKLDQLERDLGTLKLVVESNEKNYRMYLGKVEEARVAEKMDQLKMANLTVIQPASTPLKPIKPKKALNILLGLIIGGVGGIGIAFLSAYLEGGYLRGEEAAQELGIPLLTNISYKV